jgi:hypothetical protein
MNITEHGLYLVKDEYFNTFPSANWMWNKGENRPYYFSFTASDGLMWLIPMSTKTAAYKAKIRKEEDRRGKGNCTYYHIGQVFGQECAFIVSGLLPITDAYILRAYCLNQQPYVVHDKKLIQQLRSKAIRYLRLLEQRQLRDLNNVLSIRQTLLSGNS